MGSFGSRACDTIRTAAAIALWCAVTGGPAEATTPTPTVPPAATPPPCAGDCDGDGEVRINELIVAVNIALGGADPQACPAADGNGDGAIAVNELIVAVNRSLEGCPRFCADYNPLRNVYFGDLHVHTTFSFDANSYQVRTTPEEAYRFARGEPILLPPLDAEGRGTREIRLERPLDFVAVTDHAELLGEVEMCRTPGSFGYASRNCELYRAGDDEGTRHFGSKLSSPQSGRLQDVCGPTGQECLNLARDVWGRILDAAENAYDRTDACSFTSLIAYEYSNSLGVSTLHRNVIFRNNRVPFPISFYEEPTPQGLWRQLKAQCLDGIPGCDVLAIPHNSNESNHKMFFVEYPGATTLDEQRQQASLRAAMEPLLEIYQHKGDSECMNGLAGIVGEPDEFCDFEKRQRGDVEKCGDRKGQFGTISQGCVSHNDFLRGALLTGMQEKERIGVNPYRLGVIASTDTHNGAPGFVAEDSFVGHRGTDDDTLEKLFQRPIAESGGILYSPGGLAAVWAEQNTREAIFDALRRRETFGTSGPRIVVRFFGGWAFPADLCSDPAMVERGYDLGVPMGGTLPPGAGRPPTLVVSALRDPGTPERPGAPLQRIQIIKGWLENGEAHQRVYEVAGDPDNGATVDLQTCMPVGTGFDSLCAVWTDPDFDPSQPAFYYARVLENPTCRWSTYICITLPPEERPATCDAPDIPKTIQERAWTSPIWYEP